MTILSDTLMERMEKLKLMEQEIIAARTEANEPPSLVRQLPSEGNIEFVARLLTEIRATESSKVAPVSLSSDLFWRDQITYQRHPTLARLPLILQFVPHLLKQAEEYQRGMLAVDDVFVTQYDGSLLVGKIRALQDQIKLQQEMLAERDSRIRDLELGL